MLGSVTGAVGTHLAVKDRILLHLLEFVKNADDPRAPQEMTGEGIARATWIDVRHVPQNVRPLLRDGLVAERSCHVQGGTRRRKTYCLTDPGRRAAIRAREALMAQTVPVRDDFGVLELPLSNVLEQTGGRRSVLELARRAVIEGVLDRSTLDSAPVSKGPGLGGMFVETLLGAPHVDGFVGRDRELSLVTSDSGPPLFMVQGVAGIGKSWFGAKACELLHDKKNLFWHRVRPWDTSQSILADIADFIDALGRPNLRSVIVRGDGALARRILRDDLPGTNSLLVFDDAHEAVPDVLPLLRDLGDIVATANDVRMLVLTRRSLPFYDRRDVILARKVCEIDLHGLDIQELRTLIPQGGSTVALLNMGWKLGGHPLLLELARSVGHSGSAVEYLRDARRFLEEEVYQDLSAHEKTMMKLAALYQTPVPREAFFGGPELTYDVLLSLQSRALIRRVGEDAFEVHDTIRDYFDSILSDSDRTTLGHFALSQLQDLASQAEAAGDCLASIDYLSNALRLHLPSGRRVALLERLGDAYHWIGDLLQTLTAYKEGLRETEDPEVIARLHRKAARALWVRGNKAPAWDEVMEGLEALGTRRSVERGWLDLVGSFVDPSVHQDGDQPLLPIRNAIEAFREFSEKHGEAEALLSLGYVLIHTPECDLAEGERFLQDGLDLATSLSDRRLVSEGHTDLVHFYLVHNPDVEKAMVHIAAAESSVRGQDAFTRSDALYWKALAQTEFLGDFAGAAANLKEVMALARQGYDAEGSFLARHDLANLAYYRGDIVEARAQHEALWRESRTSDGFEFKWAAHSLWAAAECCLLQADRGGFESLVDEAKGSWVREQITQRIVVVDILLGIAAIIRGDNREFESRFSQGLSAAERAFRTREAPFQFRSYLVPYFYGAAIRARGQDERGSLHIARALDILQTYRMKPARDALVRNEDRFVQVLREWGSPARLGALESRP